MISVVYIFHYKVPINYFLKYIKIESFFIFLNLEEAYTLKWSPSVV
jgi:hypothetical protein